MKRCNRVVIFLYCRISHCRHVMWQLPWVSCHRGSRGSRAIVPPCLRGSKYFSRGYFVSPKFFLVGILVGSKIFCRGYFMGPDFFSWVLCGSKFVLVGISWVQNFFSWVFRGSNFFSWVFSWFRDFFSRTRGRYLVII